VLVRSTATYTRLHLHLLHPEFLADGIDRSIELEWLARPFTATRTPKQARLLLYETERVAMERLDIPHFGTSHWRTIQMAGEEPDLVLLCGERDSRVLRRRLLGLSDNDRRRQLAAIEEAVVRRSVPFTDRS
jgi:lantibiotic modifying enzyme